MVFYAFLSPRSGQAQGFNFLRQRIEIFRMALSYGADVPRTDDLITS